MRKISAAVSLLLICSMILLCGCSGSATTSASAQDVLNQIKVGWNLGNSLDSIGSNDAGDVAYYEELWGNKQTTKEDIAKIKEMGFGAVRVPVTYTNHIHNGKIDEDWLARVKEVVGYVIDEGMYCIIDMHHDTGENARINADYDKIDDNKQKLIAAWEQIADYFKDYDEHLLFEGFNEILTSDNKWTNPDSSAYTAVNELNQAFVDTVRKSGGKNNDRYLICSTYANSYAGNVLQAFQLPQDSSGKEGRLIVDVHVYATAENEITNAAELLKENLIDKNIPVIVGECGMKNSVDNPNTDARSAYIKFLVETMKNDGIICFWWDDGGQFDSAGKVNNYALLDRGGDWFFPEIAKAMVAAANE